MMNKSHIHKISGILEVLTRRRKRGIEDEDDVTEETPSAFMSDNYEENFKNDKPDQEQEVTSDEDIDMEMHMELNKQENIGEDTDEDKTIEYYDEDSYLDDLLNSFEEELKQSEDVNNEDSCWNNVGNVDNEDLQSWL